MFADDRKILAIRVAIQNLLEVCDLFLSRERGDSSLVRSVKRLQDLYLRVDLEALPYLPVNHIDTLQVHTETSRRAFAEAVEIIGKVVRTITPGNDSKIDDAYEASFNTIVTITSYQLSSPNFGNLEKRAEETVARIETTAAKIIEDAKKASEKAESILQKVRETAVETGVTQHAGVFQDEANDSKKYAKWWLAACLLPLAAFALFFAALTLPNTEKTGEVVLFVATRLAAFSVLAYALFFCVKNYAAHRHNYVVNKHRHNALRTYRALVESSVTGEMHDIVLMQAAKCIYEQRDSVYAKNDSGNNTVNFSPPGAAPQAAKAVDSN